MSDEPRVLFSGINPDASGRVPGAFGLSLPAAARLMGAIGPAAVPVAGLSTQVYVRPLGSALVAPADTVPALDLPDRTDRFLLAMGMSQDLASTFMGLGALLAATGPDPTTIRGIPSIRISFRRRRFRTCAAAQAFLDGLRRARKGAARANAAFTPTRLLNEKRDELLPARFQHTADVTIGVNLGASSVSFPDLMYPMTGRERAALRQYYLDLMVHEMGHFFVTGMMLFHGRKTLVGSGPTRRDAENDLRRQADAHQRALAVELHDTNDAYDLHTEHGRDQSEGPNNTFNAGGPKPVPFPGGRDVPAVCP